MGNLTKLMSPLDVASANKMPLSGRFIYFIVDSLDRVLYIGQTCSPAYRMTSHKSNALFDYIKMVKVPDDVLLCDAEFMEILRHKPKYNLEFPTPSFLITKTKIISSGLEHLYDINAPSHSLKISGKVRNFWIKREYSNKDNMQNDMLKLVIDELESK